MELLVLMFLLSSIESDPSLKRSLSSFLSFYRENRDLVAALAKGQTARAVSEETARAASPAEQESRPREEVGAVSVLEEYLRRASV